MPHPSSKGPNIFCHLFLGSVFLEYLALCVAQFLNFQSIHWNFCCQLLWSCNRFFLQVWIYRTMNERIDELIWKNNVFWTSTSEEIIKNYNYAMLLEMPNNVSCRVSSHRKRFYGKLACLSSGFLEANGVPLNSLFVGELSPVSTLPYACVPVSAVFWGKWLLSFPQLLLTLF